MFWPGNAQWGRILDVSRTCDSKGDLYNRLFEGESPIIKSVRILEIQKDRNKDDPKEKNGDTKEKNPDKEWNYESSPNGDTLREWLMKFVKDDKMNDKEVKIALQELIKRCKDKIAGKNWLCGGAK